MDPYSLALLGNTNAILVIQRLVDLPLPDDRAGHLAPHGIEFGGLLQRQFSLGRQALRRQARTR